MNIQDERWVSRSEGRKVDRVRTKYRLTYVYIIYDKACMYNKDER